MVDTVRLVGIRNMLTDPVNENMHLEDFLKWLAKQQSGVLIELVALLEFNRLRGHGIRGIHAEKLYAETEKRWKLISQL